MAQETPDMPESEIFPGSGRVGTSEAGPRPQKASPGVESREDSALIRASERLRRAKEEVQRLETEARLQARYAARITDQVVHEHPYVAIGAALGVGFVLGLLVSRR